ncbi:tail fiber domain-containing protein [Limnovirga soli]|uniref:Peptidase S74 domain-containing protein n=1 Tax=Limnovirga soli TaxID=2656915 RepID=A0A8J8JYL7_9BACT|nr:tail fiber domain-containing protein [Limnovirga soli]NNV57426.1 hypothetical protein [Limnovirga soli]
MKTKLLLTTAIYALCTLHSNAQNTFPAAGNVGIGTLLPAAPLQVIGASRFGTTVNYGSFDASGNLLFTGTAGYKVADNQYAFRSASSANAGLFFNKTNVRFEFRNTAGVGLFNIDAINGNVGVRGGINSTFALNVNASSTYNGINVTDPINNYAFYSVKTGNNPAIYVENSNSLSTGSVLKAVSKSNTRAVEGASSEAGTGVYGSAINGAGVYGYDASSGNGVTGYSNTGYGVTGTTGDGFAGVYGNDNNQAIGVYGRSTSGVGVFGVSNGTSLTGGYAGKFTSTNYRGIYVSSGTGWFAGYFAGDVYTTGVYSSSDAKLKKNIEDVTNAMDIINRLQPKHYEFRNDGNFAKMNLPQGKHYGLIAQELEQVLPDLVKDNQFNTRDAVAPNNAAINKNEPVNNETIDFKSVNYTELIPVIIKAMQEQDKTIQQQQAKIGALEQLINKLTAATPVNTISENANALVAVTNATIDQNVPNPFTNVTRINYTLPAKYQIAKMVITDKNGSTLKQINISGAAKGSVQIDASALASGTYSYSIFADGKIIGSKQMIVIK